MSERAALEPLVRQVATSYKLDEALVCAVIEQESAWNPWAVRYEPDFFTRYIWPMQKQGSFGVTEAHMRTISWGLMQVMGQVAREFGFSGADLTRLLIPEVGVGYGCRVLARRLEDKHGGQFAALLAYNGGADQSYPIEVLARVATYSSKAVTT